MNHYHETPLHKACEAVHGNTQIVANLISRGAIVNVQRRDGETPLHRACVWSNFELIKLLVDNGAFSDLRNHQEVLPVDKAFDF